MMETSTVLTDVMKIFLDKLKVLPQNLENSALALLSILTVIDIANQVYNVEETNWSKWLIKKIMRVGILIWLIKDWDWLLKEIIKGFAKIGEIGLKNTVPSDSYFSNPSKLVEKGLELGEVILEATSMWSPRTWANLILWVFLIVAFFFMAFSIVMIWVEFYLLTGIGVMFVPFGTLKVGENYFQNVCKVIVGCGIKMCVLNVVIMLTQPIIKDLSMSIEYKTAGFAHTITVVAILAYMCLRVPDIASGFLSGTPGMNAAAAISGGMAAVGMAIGGVKSAIATTVGGVDAAKGAVQGAKAGGSAGSKVGGNIGGAIGGVFGGAGTKIGSAIGSKIGGAVAGTAYSAYSAAKLGTNIKNNSSSGKDVSSKIASAAKSGTNTGSSSSSPGNGNSNISGANTGESNSVSTDTGTNANTDTGNVSAAESTGGNNSVNTDTGTKTETNSSGSENIGTTGNGDTAKNNHSEVSTVSTDTGTKRKAKLNGEEIDL